MEKDSLVYLGTSSIDIRFDPELESWVARSEKYPNFLAYGETSGSTLLLGPHQWTVYNDSKVQSQTN